MTSVIILLSLLSYLTGSFPSAVCLGKIFHNIDVREFGSGNSGATNTFRVLGKKIGIPVLFLDVIKGWIAVNYIFLIEGSSLLKESNSIWNICCNRPFISCIYWF